MSEEIQPQFVLNCTKCGAVQPMEINNEWGRHPGTQGLGPRPCCPALVDARRGTGAQEVCRGMLVAQAL